MGEHDGHRKRIRQLIQNGEMANMPENQVLEYLLFGIIPQADTNPTAARLLQTFGSFSNVLDADYEDLVKVDGVGPAAALFISSMPDMMAYYLHHRWKERPVLDNTTVAGMYCADWLGNAKTEKFAVICLNLHKKVLHQVVIAEGDQTSTFVSTRDAVAAALQFDATFVMFCHNHPSGSLHPSENDRMVTKQLCEAFSAIGIRVVDHIIVAGSHFTSMADRGLLF